MAKKKKDSEPSFTLTLAMKANHYEAAHFGKVFEVSRLIQNACTRELIKRERNYTQSKLYNKLLRQSKAVIKKIEKADDQEETKKLLKELNSLNTQKNKLKQSFGLNEFSMHNFIVSMKHHFEPLLDINTAQKIASRAWEAMEKKLFGSGNNLSYKKFGSLTSIEGKTNKSGITFRESEKGYYVNIVGHKVPVFMKENDWYAREALLNPKNIKYCRIIRKAIRGKVRFFVQLIIKGIPPAKRDKNTGEFKVRLGKGRTGVDPGTKTMAVASDKVALLRELAPKVEAYQGEINRTLRKIDRSKRATNPNKFNLDGTINRKNKDPWVYSINYMKLLFKLKDLYRKQAVIRRQSHCRLVNIILRTGDEFYVETMNYKALQKRAKESKISKKTGKYQRKKRFGRSIANKAPAMFISILEYKCKYLGAKFEKINTWKVKASQYNHDTEDYTKKKLHQRWSNINGYNIQRDLYAAFLIKNVTDTLDEIDNQLCNNTFEQFIKLHNQEIERLKLLKPTVSSIGIKTS